MSPEEFDAIVAKGKVCDGPNVYPIDRGSYLLLVDAFKLPPAVTLNCMFPDVGEVSG